MTMKSERRCLLALAWLAAALGGCGGGSEPSLNAAPLQADRVPLASAPEPARARALAASDPPPIDATQLMNWAESEFKQFFPVRESNKAAAPYVYRYYAATDTYLGVDGRFIRVLGPLSGGQILDVGTLDDFACQVLLATCQAPTFVQAPANITVTPGATATFSAVLGGGPSIRLQWLRGGQPVAGATGASFSFTATAADNGASLALRAENLKGTVITDAVRLTVGVGVDPVAMQALAESRGCFGCHGINRAGSGPAWRAVAAQYEGRAGAAALVAGRILNGSSRVWGPSSSMSPQPVSEAEANSLAVFILSLK